MALPPKIESRVGVAAPADVVWEAICEIGDWPAWNPLYPRAEGALRIGEKLKLTLALPGRAARDFTPPIVDWVPSEQILWSDTIARGWVRTLRYLEIEALSDESCIFSNGEQFQGWMAPYYLTRARRRTYREGFASLSEAVRERAQALWGARAGGGSR
jgi:hypothetical protein